LVDVARFASQYNRSYIAEMMSMTAVLMALGLGAGVNGMKIHDGLCFPSDIMGMNMFGLHARAN
jgi:hypothetical protein